MKHVQLRSIATKPGTGRGQRSRQRARGKLACITALSVAALLATACGSASTLQKSSSSATTAATASAAPQTSTATTQDVAQVTKKAHAARLRHPRAAHVAKTNQHYRTAQVTKVQKVQQPAAGTGGNSVNDDNPNARASRADSGGLPTTAGQPNPCNLVSRAQAETFTGHAVAVTEAPLGPTCIYQESGVKTPVTLTIETAHFATLKAHVKHPSNRTISGRTAVCARYSGSAVTYVSLPGSRVLNVAAPCGVGTQFAAAALARLGY